MCELTCVLQSFVLVVAFPQVGEAERKTKGTFTKMLTIKIVFLGNDYYISTYKQMCGYGRTRMASINNVLGRIYV